MMFYIFGHKDKVGRAASMAAAKVLQCVAISISHFGNWSNWSQFIVQLFTSGSFENWFADKKQLVFNMICFL